MVECVLLISDSIDQYVPLTSNRDMFIDASLKQHLHHRRMLDALMDDTDLVR